MTGQFLFAAASDPRDKHTRLIMRFDDGRNELRFRDVRKFGFLLCLEGEPESACAELACLGPEPLEIGLPEFASILKAHRGRIKSVLLDQRRIAGIGNIYADEILFASGIDPRAEASSLGPRRLERLWSSVREVLEEAISFKGTTVRDFRDGDGFEGLFQNRLRVYGRDGEPCPRCKAPIRRLRISGRSAHFCPRCQRR
jgi:formamidopyrimidine-DNA glycosylase